MYFCQRYNELTYNHWGKADDHNCNYGHPRWRTRNQVRIFFVD